MEIDVTKMIGDNGRPLTTGLFLDLEESISPNAVFTKDEQDKKIGDKTFYSFKRLFVECGDMTGYEFAMNHLRGWQHYKALLKNKKIKKLIDEAIEEIEVKVRSEGIFSAIGLSIEGNAAMTKLLVERGWDKGSVGRPSKEKIKREARINEKIENEFTADIKRLKDYKVM